MAVSVRMDPLLEKELESAARRKGITKSQFIVDAVEQALGRKNSFDLLLALKAQESEVPGYEALTDQFKGIEKPYQTRASRATLVRKIRSKHGSGTR